MLRSAQHIRHHFPYCTLSELAGRELFVITFILLSYFLHRVRSVHHVKHYFPYCTVWTDLQETFSKANCLDLHAAAFTRCNSLAVMEQPKNHKNKSLLIMSIKKTYVIGTLVSQIITWPF